MTSYIRSTTNLAFAPLRATHSFISGTYNLVSRTGEEAKGLVKSSISYLRRDRTAPAAALVGLGPLLLGVIKDEKTESAVKELLLLLKDMLNILQREEVQTITATSLSLLASQPVTDLVKHLSSTLITLLHVAQTPAVDKVRAQLDLYFSYLLAGDPSAGGATTSSSTSSTDPAAAAWARTQTSSSSSSSSTMQSSQANDGEEVGLRECVQLLLLVELLSEANLLNARTRQSSNGSASSSSSTPSSHSRTAHTECTCPSARPLATRLDPLSPLESRTLRGLVRKKDLQLVMLYRFHLELMRAGGGSEGKHGSERARYNSGSHHSVEGHMDDAIEDALPISDAGTPRNDSHHPVHYSAVQSALSSAPRGAWAQHHHRPGQPTHSQRSMSVNDASVFLSNNCAAPSSATAQPRPSMYTKPRTPGGNFAHQHVRTQTAAEGMTIVPPSKVAASPSAASSVHASPKSQQNREGWYSSGSGGSSDEDEAQEEGPDHRHSDAEKTTMQDLCRRHVPVQYARFIFCVREMLADMAAENGQ